MFIGTIPVVRSDYNLDDNADYYDYMEASEELDLNQLLSGDDDFTESYLHLDQESFDLVDAG